MKIIDVIWTPKVNMLVIQCDCGKEFQHRSDRWKVQCVFCYKVANLGFLRDEIVPGQVRSSTDGQKV